MIDTSDLKRNQLLEMEGAPWQVLEVSFQSPSARGASTIAKIKVRNLVTGQVLVKSFRSGDKLQLADYEKRPSQYLYCQGSTYTFMDMDSYEQVELDAELLGDMAGYLSDGLEVTSIAYKGRVIGIELPLAVELEVVETAPVIKHATAQAQPKPATLETGMVIQVPPYLEAGVRVRVDTRDGRFIERVK